MNLLIFISRNDATTQRRDEHFPSVSRKVAKPQSRYGNPATPM
jgi:hypothetical protein